jgi:hypothetical protein
MRAAACLLAIALTGVAYGGTRDPATSDQRHLDYGAQFRCVARLTSSKGGRIQMASCVILSPFFAITAAHAVAGCDPGEVITDDGRRREVVQIFVHPDYDEDTLGTRDVAVVRLGQPVSLDFYPGIYSRQDEIGKVVSIAGYGISGTFATGANISDGKKRAGSNIVDGELKGLLTCSIQGGRRTTLEYMVSPGDSGGGMFIGNELCGINSLVLSPPGRVPLGQYGDESGHARLSQPEVRDWILRILNDGK